VSLSGILVIAEVSAGTPLAASAELLGLARRLAASSGGSVTALAIGADAESGPKLIAGGADRVFFTKDGDSAEYDSEHWTACAAHVVGMARPRLILASHNSRAADLAPRLAFRLQGAVAMGCLAVELAGGKVTVTRPCFGGNAREVVAIEAAPAVVTLRNGCAEARAGDDGRSGEIVTLDFAPPARRTRVVGRHRDSGEEVRLEDARVVVAGGRGLDGPEGFEVLRDLAKALGGAVGASRVPCDLGWCPHSMQIGLTGKTVTPDLYIAVGISGAGHHLAGCGGAKSIVAINTDAEAPIFRQARFGVVGDFRRIIPELTRAIANLQQPDPA
jgi:electron transfer flavoprotein alpha subunit